jgi:pyruvate,water dikinase
MGIKMLGSYNIMNTREGIVDSLGGKLIINFSNVLTKLSPEFLMKFGNNINRVIPEVIKKYGEKYKNEKICYEIDVSILGMAWRLPIKRIIFYNFFADSTKENFKYYFNEFMEKYDKYFEALRKENEDQGIIEQRSGFKVDNLASMCMSIFDSLNDKGRREAIKRLNELAQLDQYKKED